MLPQGPLSPHTVQLCVDMQKLFGEGSPWETPWLQRVRPLARRLAAHKPERTIFTRFLPPYRPEDCAGAWRRYYERWRSMTLERLDPAMVGLLPELAELAPPATVIDKRSYSPFVGTPLASLLRERVADTLVISGSETDVCVLAAVLGAVDLGFRVVIARDAVCSSNDETHDALIKLYHRRFAQQIEIADTELILAHWR